MAAARGSRRDGQPERGSRLRRQGGDRPPTPVRRKLETVGKLLCGFALTLFAWEGAVELGIRAAPIFRLPHLETLIPAIGGLVALTRYRAALWWFATPVALLFFIVGISPWAVAGVPGLIVRDPLRKSDAVIVLSSDIRHNGDLDDTSRYRLWRGIELLRQGYAPVLVVTRLEKPKKSYVPAIRELFASLLIDYPVVETGEVRNTRDEALKAADLCTERGWRRLILVTDPTHTRRAAATFRRAGVDVLCSPGSSVGYHVELLGHPGQKGQRLRAFREWIHESIGYEVYRLRGWL